VKSALVWCGAGVLVALLLLPIAGLIAQGTPSVLSGGLFAPQIYSALVVSLATSLCSLALTILLGTPLAWILAKRRGAALGAVELLVQLPIVLPPSLAGIALLFAFGRRGLIGGLLGKLGISLAFTPAAVILAQLFVASPFYVQAASSAFRAVDDRLLQVARTLGCSPARAFFRVALPISFSALRGGAALAWARALGEFGATLLFAGNLPGTTQTLPLAIYTALESDVRTAAALGMFLLVLAFVLLLVARRSALTLFATSRAER
jgi:molybdate transport system permease protein